MREESPLTETSTTDLDGAARFFGVSKKIFRARLLPRIPALLVSAPTARRRRHRFSVDALRDALRTLASAAA